jgi:2-octaprenyl-6-methoxyphenol hydroxylase
MPHNGRAVQHFLPAGPFAILPLPGNTSCITWTEEKSEAKRIMALPDDGFLAELEKRFAELGEIAVLIKPATWELSLHLARAFVGQRIALIGDTARGVHPIAGQGLNLGLRDVAALSEIIVENARIGLTPSDPDGLKQYERWRRFDSAISTAAFDGLNRLFSNDNPLLRSLREAGLGIVDRLPMAKSMLVNEAAGLTGKVPRLLRGEAL